MNAWLITWEGTALHRIELDKIIAILSARKSEKNVLEFVQLHSLRSTCSAFNMAYIANRPKDIVFKIHQATNYKNIQYPGRFFCGSSDFRIYARQVTKLKIHVDQEKGKEILTWIEPSTWRLKDGSRDIEAILEGETGYWERNYLTPLSKEIC